MAADNDLPQLTSEAPTPMPHIFKISIAVDFGTDGIGIIYMQNKSHQCMP